MMKHYQCSKCGNTMVNSRPPTTIANCPFGTHLYKDLGNPYNNKYFWQCECCSENPNMSNGYPNYNVHCNSNPHPTQNVKLQHIWKFIGNPSGSKKDWKCIHCGFPPDFIENKFGGYPKIKQCKDKQHKYCVWERSR